MIIADAYGLQFTTHRSKRLNSSWSGSDIDNGLRDASFQSLFAVDYRNGWEKWNSKGILIESINVQCFIAINCFYTRGTKDPCYLLIAHISVLFLVHFLCAFTVCLLKVLSISKIVWCAYLWFKLGSFVQWAFFFGFNSKRFFPTLYCPLNCCTLEWKQWENYL